MEELLKEIITFCTTESIFPGSNHSVARQSGQSIRVSLIAGMTNVCDDSCHRCVVCGVVCFFFVPFAFHESSACTNQGGRYHRTQPAVPVSGLRFSIIKYFPKIYYYILWFQETCKNIHTCGFAAAAAYR